MSLQVDNYDSSNDYMGNITIIESDSIEILNSSATSNADKYDLIGFIDNSAKELHTKVYQYESAIDLPSLSKYDYSIGYIDVNNGERKYPIMTSKLISKLGYFFPTKVSYFIAWEYLGNLINNNPSINGEYIKLNKISLNSSYHVHESTDNILDYINYQLKEDIAKIATQVTLSRSFNSVSNDGYADFEIISVNYKTPQYIYKQYMSIRKYISSNIRIRIIDGSDEPKYNDYFTELESVDKNFVVERMGYNIHHGNGMHHAITTSTAKYILILDSDTYITKHGILEYFMSLVKSYPKFYAVGRIEYMNSHGINVDSAYSYKISYLHPRGMLLNAAQYNKYPRFRNHGSPCIDTMNAINSKYKNSINSKLIHTDIFEYVNTVGRGTRKFYGMGNMYVKPVNTPTNIKKNNMNIIVNVITRTSHRPNYFKHCYHSIHTQTYKNINHIVTVDDDVTYNYVKNYSDIDIVKVVPIKKDMAKPHPNNRNYGHFAPYNLFMNDAMAHCKEGIVIYMDDDDRFSNNNAIQTIVNKIGNNVDALAMWQVKFGAFQIPKLAIWNSYKQGHPPIKGQIDTIGFAFHSKYIKYAQWEEYALGDFRVASNIWNAISNKVYIDNANLTQLQRKNMGGHGNRDDL